MCLYAVLVVWHAHGQPANLSTCIAPGTYARCCSTFSGCASTTFTESTPPDLEIGINGDDAIARSCDAAKRCWQDGPPPLRQVLPWCKHQPGSWCRLALQTFRKLWMIPLTLVCHTLGNTRLIPAQCN